MVRFAAVVLSLLTIVGGARPADAQYFGRNRVHYDRFEFHVLQTEHFDIYYYPEEEAATRHAARMAERWYARFSDVLDHTFTRRQPLVLYASHSHFTQTNISSSAPGEGTGGLTERTKSRIAMPFAAGLGETDHVLGHEIAHAFQIDLAKSAGQDAFRLPGWFIEGMAEYLSLGPESSHTTMWLRDAWLHDRLPTLEQLDDPGYFPYRYGHALWSFLTSQHGDQILSQVLRSKTRGVLPRLEEVTGLDRAELTARWHQSVAGAASVDEAGLASSPGPLASADSGRLEVAPAISPDGRRLMFVSERDRVSLDVYMADAASGEILRKIISTAADPHFDSLQFIHSAGAWDATGRRFAMTALSRGAPVLLVVDTLEPERERIEIRLDDLGGIFNPSWSPDGTRVVFSAMKGGLSDLFIYSFETGRLQQLTADLFADLHPAWSPDGRTIALATDRFSANAADLSFGALRIGLLDLASGIIRPLTADAPDAKQVSPQWAPGGDAVYLISDRDGVSNVYRTELASGEMRMITDVDAGVSGITSTSPALAVASEAGTLAFSVYRNGRYEIETLAAPEADSGRLVDRVPVPSDASAPQGSVASLLANPGTGLPGPTAYPSHRYDDRLRLESIAPPYVGATTGSGFGGAIRASVGVAFADMLRDRQLRAYLRVGTDLDDFAVQAAYSNRRGQWNWGIAAGVVPSRFLGARRAIERAGELVTRETAHLRYIHQWGGLTAHYHLNRAQRFEFEAGVRRTGFEWQTVTRVIDTAERRTLSRSLDEREAGRPVYTAEAGAAFVHDTSVWGLTSPILGQRLRVEIDPAFGALAFADVRADLRRYMMPVPPVTIAVRVEHVGRYGPDAGDPRLTPLVLGLHSLVRGYDLRTFAADECGPSATACSPLDELTGSRLALLNVELRAPLVGLLSGDLRYGRLPIEVIAFADAGFLWTRRPGVQLEADRFRSIGAGGRVNLGGFIMEITAARPFDRTEPGWRAGVLLRPGW